jgi:hypothetical protein
LEVIVRVEEVNKDIVGLVFNGIMVTQVTDGTLDTVPKAIYRYKFPVKDGYLKDREERTIIKESRRPMFGARINGKQLGTELIDVKCGDPDDMRVWWVVDPKFTKKPIGRDPGTKRPIMVDVLVRGTEHFVGSYQEFIDLVNSRNGDESETVIDAVGDEPGAELFSEEDIEYIRKNYRKKTDQEMADELGVEFDLLRDFRLKTLKLKKPKGGARGK